MPRILNHPQCGESIAGAVPINVFAVACELQLDWREDGDRLKAIAATYIPEYGNLITSNEGVIKSTR
jgi:hypothetical protein